MKKDISKKLRVTVGIPAFNEESNIKRLLLSILRQNQNIYHLDEIIVASDASTDKTVSIVKELKDKKIKLIEGKKRMGQFRRIGEIIMQAKSDVIVLFDADIALGSDKTVSNLVTPFYKSKKIGLVGAARRPIPGKTFIEKAVHTSIHAYDNIASRLRGGNNPYNCHGASLALSKEFAELVKVPKEIFSGDTFLYFLCLSKGFEFRFAPQARTWFKTADSLSDAIKQYSRFLGIDDISKRMFGNLIDKEYQIPLTLKYKYILQETLRWPLHTFVMQVIILYCRYASNKQEKTKSTWSIAQSTKTQIRT